MHICKNPLKQNCYEIKASNGSPLRILDAKSSKSTLSQCFTIEKGTITLAAYSPLLC
jgi:hypothetical protein